MRLTLLLDALSAVGEAKAMVFLVKFFLLGVLPFGVLIYLLVRLANQRLDEHFDREWDEQKARAAANQRHTTLFLILACFLFISILWSHWPAD